MERVKSYYDYEKDECKFLDDGWCELPKFKRCKYCIRLKDGSKACMVAL